MNLPRLATGIALLFALGLAWALGGAAGAGVLAGFLTGVAVAAVGLLVQVRVVRERPALVFAAVLGDFLLKAFALLACTAVVRFVEPLSARLDWRAYAVAFATAALVILMTGTVELLRQVRAAPAAGAGGAWR